MRQHVKAFWKPIVLFAVGAILSLGPLWAFITAIVATSREFGNVSAANSAEAEALASDIMFVGWLMIPAGTVLIIIAGAWMIRIHAKALSRARGGL